MPKLKIDKQLSKDNILRLVKTFRNVDPKQEGALEMLTLPNAASTSQPGRLDCPARGRPAAARLRTFGGDPTKAPVAREADTVVSVLNGSDKDGEAGKSVAKLQLRGFGPGEVGNVKPLAPKTLVRYAPGALAKAELVARYLGGVGTLIEDPSISGVDVVLVIGSDWRGVHGKGKTVEAPSTTTTTVKKTSTTTAKGQKPAVGTAVPAC